MNVSVQQAAQQREHTPWRALIANQPFWVTIALALICLVMAQHRAAAMPSRCRC